MKSPDHGAPRPRYRSVRAASILLAAAGLATSASAGTYSWIGGPGSWQDPNKWIPFGVPDTNDTALIGNLQTAAFSTVLLTGPKAYDALYISDGMTVDCNGFELVSFGIASITGAGSRIIARPAPGAINEEHFQGELAIGPGGILDLRDGAPVKSHNDCFNSGEIIGCGYLEVGNVHGMPNNGVIRPSEGDDIVIQHGTIGNQMADLDGTGGNGTLDVSAEYSGLEVIAGSFIDPFDGTILLGRGSELTMNVAGGWQCGTGCALNVLGPGMPSNGAKIDGTPLDFDGLMTLDDQDARLRFLMPVTFGANTGVDIAVQGELELDSESTFLGGQYIIGQFGKIQIDGPVLFEGGEFSTYSDAPNQGIVRINGPAVYDGTVAFNGFARQNGDVQVTGPTIINADVFDLDGAFQTVWEIGSSLTINADSIDTLDGPFDGTFDIAGGVFSKLTLNLSDPQDAWRMDGQMDLFGLTHLIETRVAGSRMIMNGDLNVLDGRVRISADAEFAAHNGAANVDLGPSDSELIMDGFTRVRAAAMFSGLGSLVVGPSGHMVLEAGTTTGLSALANKGRLEVGSDSGSASVDEFTNEPGATWRVSVGGYTQGDEHDLLIVSGGGAALGGTLEVKIDNLGEAGFFAPKANDEFTILTALGGVTGTFLEEPVSFTPTATYYWDIVYEPNAVLLRLDWIGRAPACCPGNATRDEAGTVDFGDITSILMHWLEPGDGTGVGDANCDGIVDFEDITAVLQHWGDACP